MHTLKVLLFLCFTYANCVIINGAKLLAVFPMPGRSHYFLASNLMKAVAKAGHEVTFITPYPTKDIPENVSWNDVVLDGLADNYANSLKAVKFFDDSKKTVFERIKSYQDIMTHWVNATLYHPKVRYLLTSEQKFDAVIMEHFYNHAHKYFAYQYQCQLILTTSLAANPWVNNVLGAPNSPSYIQHFYSIKDFSYQSFYDRLRNLLYYISEYLLDYFYIHPLHNGILQKAFPGAPRVEDLNENVSLVLANGHESILEAAPTVPNLINIGGFHVVPPKELSKELKDFMDNASDGVIYFSMGSHVNSEEMPVERRKIFMNVFGQLKQKVLIKFEDTNATDIPENVMVQKWMPQNDILAHPNIKLFITHSGLGSTIETIHHGVPILGLPIYADQYLNSNKAVQGEYGLRLPYNDPSFSERLLADMIKELINNPKYFNNAKVKSRVFHDRPMKPLDTAVYWIDYVLRHNGANHLKVAGAKLPLYQYLMLDVIGSVIFGVGLGLFGVRLVVKWLVGCK